MLLWITYHNKFSQKNNKLNVILFMKIKNKICEELNQQIKHQIIVLFPSNQEFLIK